MRAVEQRGAATLVVVMVLFFVISMVAAYTSRNMIFEQRTGANMYRATQSFEAAEAGMNWALMQLNGGRIDSECRTSTNIANDSFRQRYLTVDAGSGVISPRWLTPPVPPATVGTPLAPTCVFDSATGSWRCSCPVNSAPSLTAPTGSEVAPAFRVRFSRPVLSGGADPEAGLVRIDVVGCTRLDDDCLDASGASLANEGRTVLGAVFMLSGRATAYPQAALSARGDVTASGLNVINAVSAGSGITVHASGIIDVGTPSAPRLFLTTSAGNALGGSTLDGDAALNLPTIPASGSLPAITTAERFFAATFLLTPQRWVQMPGVVTVTCPVGGCPAATVRTAIANNPGRPLWLTGDLLVDSAGDIGSAPEPVVLVISGNLVFSSPGVTVHGLVMIRTSWNTAASTQAGTIRGAVIVDGGVTGASNLVIQYDSNVMSALRRSSGTYFRVAGSWRDWAMP